MLLFWLEKLLTGPLWFRFLGVSDIAAVRFSLPAQLLEPTPNLGMPDTPTAYSSQPPITHAETTRVLTEDRILELPRQAGNLHKVSLRTMVFSRHSDQYL